MKFGGVAPDQALGATAVHSIRQGELVLKKGTRIGAAEVAALKAAGVLVVDKAAYGLTGRSRHESSHDDSCHSVHRLNFQCCVG